MLNILAEVKDFNGNVESWLNVDRDKLLRLMLSSNTQRISVYEVLSVDEKRLLVSIYRQFDYQSLQVVTIFNPF